MSPKESCAALAAFLGTAAEYLAQHCAWAVRRSRLATTIEFAHVIPPAPCNKELRRQSHESASHGFVSLITFMALPQVLFDCLAGNRIQFAIQITIHQFCSFFAVHLFILTDVGRQIFLKFAAGAGEPRHNCARAGFARSRLFPCRRDLPGVAAPGSHEIPQAIHPSLL